MLAATAWSDRHQEFLHVWVPILAGFGFIALCLILYRIWKGNWRIGKLAEGQDLRPSTSKFQVLLWTIVVLFGYVVVETARFVRGNFDPIEDIPQNVLIALGFTLATATVAKGITSSYVANGRVAKTSNAKAGFGSILTDDDGVPDLSKAQLLAWTLISIAVYLFRVMYQLRIERWPALPDIDAPLMVLMGLGQGAYLGKKLTT